MAELRMEKALNAVAGSSCQVVSPVFRNNLGGSFDDFSVDLLTAILLKTNPTVYELCAWSTLSQRIKTACYSGKLWQKVDMVCHPKKNIYGWGLEMMAGRCMPLEELVMKGINVPDRPNPWMHYGLEKLLERCGKLRLRVLQLKFVCQLPFTDLLLTKVGNLCPLLEDFELSATNYFATDSAVTTFIRACPKLVHFRCFVKEGGPLHALSDVTLWQIAKKLPGLRTLEINGYNMTENGLFGLEDCKHLERLGLHGYKRGVFDRARTQEGEKVTEFPCLREILFSHILPSAGELRGLLRMAPSLSLIELQPHSTDERMKSHAENLVLCLRSEFSHIEVILETLLPDGVEQLTAAMLTSKLLEKEERRRERERKATEEATSRKSAVLLEKESQKEQEMEEWRQRQQERLAMENDKENDDKRSSSLHDTMDFNF